MRGKVNRSCGKCKCSRITPAYAGKSREYLQNIKETQDHPRLCGEKLRDTADFTHVAGSPPPMRGKVRMHEGKLAMDRITPAYAGKSQ